MLDASEKSDAIYSAVERALRTFDSRRSTLTTYIYRLLCYRLVEVYRKRSPVRFPHNAWEKHKKKFNRLTSDLAISGKDEITMLEVCWDIQTALNRLPDLHRRLIVFRYFCDLTLEEIAGRFGNTRKTVASHEQIALSEMREVFRNGEEKKEKAVYAGDLHPATER